MENGSGDDEDDARVELVRAGVLRRVLWGDAKEEVMRLLDVNGVSHAKAETVYRWAVDERVRTIRGAYWGKIWLGLAVMAVGALTYGGLWFYTDGFAVYGLRSATLPGLALGYGLWKFTTGLAGVMTATSREGPVADVE